MSQKKVDSYKEKKANRKQIIKKEKTILRLEKLAAAIIGVVIVCWVGFSVYGKVVESQENVVTETAIDTTAIDNYMSNLAVEDDVEVVEDTEEVVEEEVVEEEAAEEEVIEETTEEEVVEDTEEEAAEEETAEEETTEE